MFHYAILAELDDRLIDDLPIWSVAAWKCDVGGENIMQMKSLGVVIISLALIGLIFYPAPKVEAQETLAEQILGIIKFIVNAIYSLISQLLPFVTVIISTFGALLAGLFATSPEFFSAFIAGFVCMIMMGYIAFGMFFPHSWIALLITFLTGFPICILDPIMWISFIVSIPIGIIVGIILGVFNLMNLKTPAEKMNIPLEDLSLGTMYREDGEWKIKMNEG